MFAFSSNHKKLHHDEAEPNRNVIKSLAYIFKHGAKNKSVLSDRLFW